MDKASASSTPFTQNPNSGLRPADMDLTGMTLGDFKIRRRLGQGGMGQVYLAEQISLKREVALKTLRPDLAANHTSLERFDAEAKAVAKATHANIVQIYVIDRALVQNQMVHYLALEYVEGRNLRELLEKKGTPELLIGLSIMHQVGSALQRASELGIIHRDIKPENILITRQGEVKVADFGLSRCFTDPNQPQNLTQTGVTMGTPLYMAPEQVELRTVDPRTDIYSFGVTCYHMFAGQPPFKGNSPFEVAVQHVQKEPPPLKDTRPDLPPDLCALIHRMMAKKPEDRPQTSREIVREVSRLRDMLVGGNSGTNFAVLGNTDGSEPVTAPAPAAERSGNWLRRLLLPALTVLLALGAGLGGSYFYWTRPIKAAVQDDEKDLAQRKIEDKEKELIRAKDEHWPPRKTADVRYALDLGVFYLHEGRFDRAAALFEEMNAVKEFGDAGKVGAAMVLAFQNKAQLSTQMLKDLLPSLPKGKDKQEKVPDDMPNAWRNHAAWRKMLATALFHDKMNLAPAVFPAPLDQWLRAPGPSR